MGVQRMARGDQRVAGVVVGGATVVVVVGAPVVVVGGQYFVVVVDGSVVVVVDRVVVVDGQRVGIREVESPCRQAKPAVPEKLHWASS